MYRLLFLLFFLLLQNFISAQEIYQPLVNFLPDEKVIEALAFNLENPDYPYSTNEKNILKKLKEIEASRGEYLNELYDEDQLMQNDPITTFLQDVLDSILYYNKPEFPDKATVLTIRTSDINASSIGKGLIFVNIGLLDRIENWEEIAFILAHEIGHDYLKHAINASEKRLALILDKSFKKEVKRASKQTYGGFSAANELYQNRAYLTSSQSRVNEIASDSMGYYFIHNAGLDKEYALDALRMLDSADYFNFTDTFDLKEIFSTKNYELKNEWLSKNDASSNWSRVEGLYEIPDSLKSHPDCSIRIDQLSKTNFPDLKRNSNRLDFKARFEALKKAISFENILTQIENGSYSYALYNAINLKKKFPEEVILDYMIAHSMLEIIIAMKKQKFVEHVPFPNVKFPGAYNNLLSFLHNVNSSKLTKLYDVYIMENLKENELPEYMIFLDAMYAHYISNNINKGQLTHNYEVPYHQKRVKEIDELLNKKK